MINQVYTRDGTFQEFDLEKIANAIFKAARACGGNDRETAENLANEVVCELEKKFGKNIPTVEEIQNCV